MTFTMQTTTSTENGQQLRESHAPMHYSSQIPNGDQQTAET
jgi:hypothetical protein